MRRSPSIVPAEHDQNVYLVLDDFGHLGPGMAGDRREGASTGPRSSRTFSMANTTTRSG